jgi:BlaI family transcriptional regulator, penicillinase repressor
MTSDRTFRLGDLQLRIMKVLWAGGPGTVAEVQEKLGGDALAYTTVATMLRKMEDRQLVAHRQEGRRFVYGPLVTAEEVTSGMAGDLVDRLFAGSLTDAVSHLLEAREVSHHELARLEELIARHKQRL